MKYIKSILTVLAAALIYTTPAVAAEFVVIVNKANPVAHLPKSIVAKYFSMDLVFWDDGKKVIPVDLVDSNPLARQFAQAILEMDLDKKRRIWLTKIFAGKAAPPQQLKTDEAVIAVVSAEPGAIGYIAKSSFTDKVKIVIVDEQP